MSNEIASVRPSVYIGTGGVPPTYTDETSKLYCVEVVDSFGITPSTATFRYIPTDESVPTLVKNLPLNSGTLKADQRVIVVDEVNQNIFFHGWIKSRHDQGAPAVSLWSAVDDRSLLQFIYVRGCLIKDVDGQLRYSATVPTIMNPGGAWNCIGHTHAGTTYPVFAHTAYYGRAYESPDEAFPSGLSTTEVSPWTPRRALEYLRLMIHYKEILGVDRVEGMTGLVESYILQDILEVQSADSLIGIDTAISAIDPLDKKLQELSLQGDAFLGAFSKVLTAAGTHDMDIYYDTTSLTGGKSQLRYRPIGASADNTYGNPKPLKMQVRGTADEYYGDIYDFSLQEDYSNTTYSVIVEGEAIKVETQVEYDPASPSLATIEPAWSSDEQDGFLKCIYGSTTLSGPQGDYAIAPRIHGDPNGTFDSCDGTGSLPQIYPLSTQAVAMARQHFPTVFRAWRLVARGDLEDALKEPAGSNGFIKAARPVLPEQLQFYTWLSTALGDDRLRANLPIRVQVKYSPNQYFDVPRDVAVRVTADKQGSNLIWLEGMAESADGSEVCIYDGSLYLAPDIQAGKIATRAIKVNCAVPTDYRVYGVDTYSRLDLDGTFQAAIGGVSQMVYIDAPDSFREHLQYKSYPTIGKQYYGGTAGTTGVDATGGLTRALPPGSEATHAQYAAQRELSRRKHPIRKSSWMRAGIDTYIEAGDWISKIQIYSVTESGEQVSYYDLDSSVGKVTWDFLNQQTIVGDVFGEVMT